MSRDAFYPVPGVPIDDLLLDTHNPRIRHGQDQNDCLMRLLRDRANFVNLCKDIAARGLTPEHILVSRNVEGKWVVRDGNRRVAALKLLNRPGLVQPADTPLFNTLTKAVNAPGANVPAQIDCLGCDDEKTILDYLELKHTGENQGIGQRNWSSLLKSLFNIQAQVRDDYKRAAQLLLWVEERGYPVEDDFFISTLQRGLNTDTLALIGFAVQDDELTPTLPEHQAYALAARVVRAVDTGEVNVKREEGEPGSIFTTEAQLAFFAAVRNELGPAIVKPAQNPTADPLQTGNDPNVPTPSTSTPAAAPGGDASPTADVNQLAGKPSRKPSSPNTAPRDRICLFGPRKNASPGVSIPDTEPKVQSIIVELRKLNPHDTPLATTMLLRALIELSNEHYRTTNSLKGISDLHRSVANTADHMKTTNKLTEQQHDIAMAYTRSEASLLHIKNLQATIHRSTHHPNGQALNTMWDDIGCFVLACWR